MSLQPKAITSFFLRVSAIRAVALYAVHTVVFTACYAAAWLVRFEFSIPPEYLPVFKASFAVVVGIQLLVGVFFSFYRGWWRYVGLADVVRLVFGMTTSLAVLIGAWYLGGTFGIDARFVKVPRGVLLIDWSFSLLTLFGARVAIRLGRDRFRGSDEAPSSARRVLIVGAGDAGETLAREIEHRPQLGMKVVGFVDDQRAKWHSHIRGINIYGPISSIGTLADTLGADEALIAIPSASGKRIREILHHLAAADLRFKTMPGIDHLVSGKVHVTQLRPVNVEDLMRRKRVDLPGDPVRELFRGKRVLVTGAGGTIGTELAVQIAQFEPESLVLLERSEFALYESRKRLSREVPWSTSRIIPALVNLTDYDVVDATLAREKPQIVLHAAAHKHVGLGEENPPEYVRNNCVATRRLAELCTEHNVERFVLISTDKAINPTSVMGASKRAAEIALLDVASRERMKVTAVRFGNVIGSSGSVIPLFMEQIAAGGPVTVTHPEVTRYFLRTSEAVSLVLQAATLGAHGCIFMLDMGEPVKIVDLARDMIRLSNHTEEEIPIVFTGLRAGEKLYEEIRLEGESIKPTVHPQIVVTEAPQPDSRVVAQWLEKARMATSATETISLLARLVPEYTPAVPVAAPPPSFADRPLRIVSESGATV
ncbi:MAG TPA: nucleoside-diphosphate sugar epimerase/dehydratase [Thermoanaerobaculia bacterium]|nr:nucleoside-diphosphate sugar epimerase/dehydratase [Thermoanaerobaculia bacterium]